ncbi:MAG: pyrroline-5-carboxylate reductase [Gammaproteobacteria bacterium]
MHNSALRIGFVGGGNMAGAMLAGLLRAGHPAGNLQVADPKAERRAQLAQLSKDLLIVADNVDATTGADVIVLAVKPQLMPGVAKALQPGPQQLFVSVAAGISLAAMHEWFGPSQPCVRSMPNQPALVGAGMSVLCAATGVSDTQRAQAEYLAGAAGSTAWVDDEGLMDAVTAVSGSGPAYFYLVMEILEDCARDMGIPAEVARQLAVQTAYGAGLAAREAQIAPGELRQMVTSPGGTTQAAIEVLQQGGLDDLLRQALTAARRRSMELGGRKSDQADLTEL